MVNSLRKWYDYIHNWYCVSCVEGEYCIMSTDYEKYFRQGTYASVRTSRFDSKSEEKVCLILNRILNDYDLEKYMQIRLTPQQALENYVEVKDEEFKRYYRNKYKWMKFDFIFEEVYEYENKMHYIPVAVVEFDGPNHDTDEQKKLDYYKNGIVSNIGADMVRIKYNELRRLNEIELRKVYEDDVIRAIIKGYFTKSVNYRKSDTLINEGNQKKFNRIEAAYKQAVEEKTDKTQYYANMLRLLYWSKELGFSSSN